MQRNFVYMRAFVVLALIFASVPVAPASGQVTVDSLLGQIIDADNREQYDLVAEFQADLILMAGGKRTAGSATGTLRESRRGGERRWKATVQRLGLPLLMRPFAGTLRSLIEDRFGSQSEMVLAFNNYDFLVQDERGGRYALIAVRRDIVNEAFDRYGKVADKQDVEIRRHIARWLFTSPSMKPFLVRSGPPYAMRLLVDERGVVYENSLLYNWGHALTRMAYTNVSGRPVWHDVHSTITIEFSRLGRVEGQLTVQIRNYVLTIH